METITRQLTAIARGGAALGRNEGRVILLPYALPGRERVSRSPRTRAARLRLVETVHPVSTSCPSGSRWPWRARACPAPLRIEIAGSICTWNSVCLLLQRRTDSERSKAGHLWRRTRTSSGRRSDFPRHYQFITER
jgi:hypothetical protein